MRVGQLVRGSKIKIRPKIKQHTQHKQHPLQFAQPLIKSLLPPLRFVLDVVLYYHNVLALPLKYLVTVTPNGSNI